MKITIHPLFLAAGLLSALFGGLPEFIICALTALLHECGHVFYAAKLGLECKKISLMPYGASATCEMDGLSPRDEIFLAMAGPAVNLVLCVLVAGLWWFFPQSYAYTDTVFYANAAMLVLNLLPAYPLDGGRVIKGLLKKFFQPKKTEIGLRIATALVAAALVLIFFLWRKNFSLLAVAGFLICSAFEKNIIFERINYNPRRRKRGREIKYIILDENATFRDALKFTDGGRFVVFQIYGDKFIDEITEDELFERMTDKSLYDKIV